MLSPSQQAYCFEEIEDTKGTALYPADGDELFRQLRAVLGEKDANFLTPARGRQAAQVGGGTLIPSPRGKRTLFMALSEYMTLYKPLTQLKPIICRMQL